MTTFCVAALSLTDRPAVRTTVRCSISSDFAISVLLLFMFLHSGCIRTGVQSGSPYILFSDVNEPVSLPVRNIMRPVIYVSRHFMTSSVISELVSCTFFYNPYMSLLIFHIQSTPKFMVLQSH